MKVSARAGLFSIITVVTVLALLEGLARLVEPHEARQVDMESGWQQKFFGALFDWHEGDPDLLWRFKAGLNHPLIRTNSHHLLGDEVTVPKPSGVYRLLLLGDSSPVGLGLASRQQAFGEIARYLLDKEIGAGRRVELVNAAVSGYTSEQIVRFLDQRGWEFEPDMVILYCGNNDASISGTAFDRQVLSEQRFKSLRRWLYQSALYRLIRAAMVRLYGRDHGHEGYLQVRVPPREFGENLEKIYRQCHERDCPLVILKPPVPYLWPAGLQFKPFQNVVDAERNLIFPPAMIKLLGRDIGFCLDDERMEALYGRPDIFTSAVYRSGLRDTIPADEAAAFWSTRAAADPDPLTFNNLGVALWRQGDYIAADQALKKARQLYVEKDDTSWAALAAGSPILFNIGLNLLTLESGRVALAVDSTSTAFAFLDSALQYDFFSLRIKRSYWEEIDRLAGREGMAVIDLPTVFMNGGGERLFIDHCHPTADGHFLIAREIVRTIRERHWL